MKIYAVFACLLAIVFALPTTLQATSENEPTQQLPQPTMSFAVVSDIHVQQTNPLAIMKWKRALRDIETSISDAAALVVNGDLTDGQPGDYNALQAIMSGTKHPPNLFFTIGNHEYYKAWHDAYGNWSPESFPNGETDAASRTRFLQFAGLNRVYYDRWVNGHHFIMLGSERYRQRDPSVREDAWLSDEQLEWLKHKLAEREDGRPIFVFLHQPLGRTVAGSSAADNDRGVVQRDRLLQILQKHPQVFLFTGHSHAELSLPNTLVQDGITMINSSSVYEPYDRNYQAYNQEMDRSEGLMVHVYADKVVVKGRDFARSAWIPEAQFEVQQRNAAQTDNQF